LYTLFLHHAKESGKMRKFTFIECNCPKKSRTTLPINRLRANRRLSCNASGKTHERKNQKKENFILKSETTHLAGPAFTLVELLVTISIMIILASLLFPALKNARDKANQILCSSNLKQQGTALLVYGGDYNSMMIPASQVGGYPDTWDTVLAKKAYIGSNTEFIKENFKIFYCPSDNLIRSINSFPRSYGLNSLYCENGRSIKLLLVKSPSETIYTGEQRLDFLDEGSRINKYGGCSIMGMRSAYIISRPWTKTGHGTGSNYLFIDSHAEWVNANDLNLAPGNNPGLSRENPIYNWKGGRYWSAPYGF
jgi:prepilin-type processing-associated H-X9-DG protein